MAGNAALDKSLACVWACLKEICWKDDCEGGMGWGGIFAVLATVDWRVRRRRRRKNRIAQRYLGQGLLSAGSSLNLEVNLPRKGRPVVC